MSTIICWNHEKINENYSKGVEGKKSEIVRVFLEPTFDDCKHFSYFIFEFHCNNSRLLSFANSSRLFINECIKRLIMRQIVMNSVFLVIRNWDSILSLKTSDDNWIFFSLDLIISCHDRNRSKVQNSALSIIMQSNCAHETVFFEGFWFDGSLRVNKSGFRRLHLIFFCKLHGCFIILILLGWVCKN